MVMNCEAVRERLAAEPSRHDAEVERHLAGCAPCRAFRVRLLNAENLIDRALKVDVGALRSRGLAAAPAAARSRRMAVASFVAVAGLGALTAWGLSVCRSQSDSGDLALDVVQHWYREPESWVKSDTGVSSEALAGVLAGSARIDRSRLATITFVKSCHVGSEQVPHLVVQGDDGPYMVLLLAGVRLENPVPLELREEGLAGEILPAGAGSIAVLGSDSPELGRLEREIISAVDWTI
jgi:Protein of unknown function (DUF3379)